MRVIIIIVTLQLLLLIIIVTIINIYVKVKIERPHFTTVCGLLTRIRPCEKRFNLWLLFFQLI